MESRAGVVNAGKYIEMSVSKNNGGPPNHPMFNRVSPYFHHPFWGVNIPIFGGPPK